jgi:hypothetical protein
VASPSSPAGETAALAEPSTSAEAAGLETVEEHPPAEENGKIESSEDGKTKVPGESGPDGSGGEEK